MEEETKEIFDPASLCQIGVVVRNVEATIRYYREKFHMGPFEIRHVDYPTASFFGETGGYRGKRAFFQLGPLQVELIELIDGKTIHESFLEEKGEGLHHLGFRVEDLGRAMGLAESQGFRVTQHFQREDGSGFAYLDTERTGGVVFELIAHPAKK